MTRFLLTTLALCGATMASQACAAQGTVCELLSRLKLPATRITDAALIVPAPQWPVPESVFTRLAGNVRFTVAVPFCRVQAVIEKEIHVEVWLPRQIPDTSLTAYSRRIGSTATGNAWSTLGAARTI
jgi:hypothetical protein